jgi:hypothetical protein
MSDDRSVCVEGTAVVYEQWKREGDRYFYRRKIFDGSWGEWYESFFKDVPWKVLREFLENGV